MPLTNIESYQVIYSANSFVPRIGLLSGGKYVGQLIFHPDAAALPPDSMAGTQAQLHYHLADFANVIDVLRNEKPVSLLYSGSGGGFENAIETSPEPVGEAETLKAALTPALA
jgi:hypothetical protein